MNQRFIVLILLCALFYGAVALAASDSDARDAVLWKASKDPKIVAKGKDTYNSLCKNCHGEEKNTVDAPSNLFDTKWYHGGTPREIEHSIQEGFLDKGMPPWKDALPAEDIEAVVGYLLSFQPAPNGEKPLK